MALSVFMHGSRRLPIISNTASKLLTTQLKNSQLVITPIIAKHFTGFNRQIQETKKLNNAVLTQPQNRMISHSAIWSAEKIVSLGLLGIIPAGLIVGGPVFDNLLAVSVVMHMHWGIEAVVVDYVRPILFGNFIPTVAKAMVYALSIFTLAGLLYFNYNDIGISRAVKRLWAIKPAGGSKE